jgi:hypothetical protein
LKKDTSPPLKLGKWLGRQRQAKRGSKGRNISAEQIRRLEELGVWWDQPDTWETHFSALVQYKAGEGDGDPNCSGNYATKDIPPLKLGSWLNYQRQAKKDLARSSQAKKDQGRSKISDEHIRRLEELGVWWDQPDTWETHFSALERYKNGEGNGDPNCLGRYVTKDTSPPLKLGQWLNYQRQARRATRRLNISAEQIRRLEEIGVWWDQPAAWETHFSALERYKNGEGNGDPNCPQSYSTKDASLPLKLGSWLSNQRQAKKNQGRNKISAEQIRRLEELGVWWENPCTQCSVR